MEGSATDDDDYDIEESTVLVELQGVIETDFLTQVKHAKILGIDSDKPFLQLDDYTFSGEYRDSHGTELIFKDVTDDQTGESGKERDKKLQYECLTNKKLCVQRIFLKNEPTTNQKQACASSSTPSSAETPSTSTDPVGSVQDHSVETDAVDIAQGCTTTTDDVDMVQGHSINTDGVDSVQGHCVETDNVDISETDAVDSTQEHSIATDADMSTDDRLNSNT